MIEINIKKDLKDFLLNINLDIKNGEFLALQGKSGSGKTTFFRILAGLEKAKGSIVVNGKVWQDKNIFLPPQKREIGFVFQDYALFENMTVLENLLFVKKDIKLAEHLLKVTELNDLKNRYPANLSGGQKQRVSLARAMMKKPKILLLDEPLSALDIQMRLKLQNEIRALHDEFGTTTIMVSHDIAEIYKLADKLAVIDNGKIVKIEDIKSLASEENLFLEGYIVDILEKEIVLSIGNQLIKIEKKLKNFKIGERIRVYVPKEALILNE
ncbi:sulfate/molybdate ABC transporter ATP-binding protein [Nitrosophilus kaiyonis]|uniref:sulfate/molybdate ABC transporter ATP-binding protein n=1 Tax=Nitrosophilus kaiyonis TaxID=2930200 RepID=UPI0024919380|nr:ATP-binding cassette domain-containing protein [Nitrosophilus kaiyonis]